MGDTEAIVAAETVDAADIRADVAGKLSRLYAVGDEMRGLSAKDKKTRDATSAALIAPGSSYSILTGPLHFVGEHVDAAMTASVRGTQNEAKVADVMASVEHFQDRGPKTSDSLTYGDGHLVRSSERVYGALAAVRAIAEAKFPNTPREEMRGVMDEALTDLAVHEGARAAAAIVGHQAVDDLSREVRASVHHTDDQQLLALVDSARPIALRQVDDLQHTGRVGIFRKKRDVVGHTAQVASEGLKGPLPDELVKRVADRFQVTDGHLQYVRPTFGEGSDAAESQFAKDRSRVESGPNLAKLAKALGARENSDSGQGGVLGAAASGGKQG